MDGIRRRSAKDFYMCLILHKVLKDAGLSYSCDGTIEVHKSLQDWGLSLKIVQYDNQYYRWTSFQKVTSHALGWNRI